jgi:hypothetical protein
MLWATVTLLRRPVSLVPWIRYPLDPRRPLRTTRSLEAGNSRARQHPARRPPRRTSAAPAMIALQRGLQLGCAANNPSTNPI